MAEREPTTGDALTEIHAEGGDSALKLVGNLMAANARMSDDLMTQVYEGEKADHERTKAQLREARHRLAIADYRVAWLLGQHDDPFGDPWDLGP